MSSDLALLCRISAEAPRIAANIAKLPELKRNTPCRQPPHRFPPPWTVEGEAQKNPEAGSALGVS